MYMICMYTHTLYIYIYHIIFLYLYAHFFLSHNLIYHSCTFKGHQGLAGNPGLQLSAGDAYGPQGGFPVM